MNRIGRGLRIWFKNLAPSSDRQLLLPTRPSAVRADCGRQFAGGLWAKAEPQFGCSSLWKGRHVLVFLGCLQSLSLSPVWDRCQPLPMPFPSEFNNSTSFILSWALKIASSGMTWHTLLPCCLLQTVSSFFLLQSIHSPWDWHPLSCYRCQRDLGVRGGNSCWEHWSVLWSANSRSTRTHFGILIQFMLWCWSTAHPTTPEFDLRWDTPSF